MIECWWCVKGFCCKVFLFVAAAAYSQLLCGLLAKYLLVSELHNARVVRQVFLTTNFSGWILDGSLSLAWQFVHAVLEHDDPGHVVLDGDPAPPLPKKGHSSSPIFGPCLIWPNDWMHQDTTWYGSRPRPRRYCDDCVRWEPTPPHFSAHFALAWSPISATAELLF